MAELNLPDVLPSERRSTTASAPHAETISLLDLLRVVIRWRWLIIVITLISAAVVLAVALLSMRLPVGHPLNRMPDIFRPTVSVLLLDMSEQQGGMSSLLGDTGGGLATFLEIPGSSNSAELAQTLLIGRWLRDQIAEEFGFVARYELTEHPRTKARQLIGDAMTSEFDPDSEVLTIAYQDTDPEFATAVLGRAVELLEERFRTLTTEKVNEKKSLLETRLEAVGAERLAAQQALIQFQRRYGVVYLNAQARESVDLVTGFKQQIYTKELERQNLLDYRNPDDPAIVRIENELTQLNRLVSELETGFRQFSSSTIPQSLLPELSATFQNLIADLSIQEAVYGMLRQQYESARIEAADQSRSFQVIEAAEVPEVKFKPSRGTICVVVTVAAALFAVMLAFVFEYFSRVKRDPEEAEKLEDIKAMLSLRRKSRIPRG